MTRPNWYLIAPIWVNMTIGSICQQMWNSGYKPQAVITELIALLLQVFIVDYVFIYEREAKQR